MQMCGSVSFVKQKKQHKTKTKQNTKQKQKQNNTKQNKTNPITMSIMLHQLLTLHCIGVTLF